jgi:hypothetical protein
MIVMTPETDDVLARNSLFLWIALATLGLLSIPLVAMQFTTAVQWDATDFLAMGTLLSGTASLFVLAARKTAHRHRVVAGVVFATAFLALWMELAVGVFTNLGN